MPVYNLTTSNVRKAFDRLRALCFEADEACFLSRSLEIFISCPTTFLLDYLCGVLARFTPDFTVFSRRLLRGLVLRGAREST